MIFIIAMLLAPPLADAGRLQRQNRQDTIYVIRGKVSALTAFDAKFGAAWTGGTIIDGDPSDGMLTYWAYSNRTAAEARALIIPAIVSHLQMSFEKYREADQFPVERNKLDQVALKCGVETDPYFITPKRTVEVSFLDDVDAKSRKCLLDGVRLEARLQFSTARQSPKIP